MAKKKNTFKTPMMEDCLSQFFALSLAMMPAEPPSEQDIGIANNKMLCEIERINSKIEELMDCLEDHEGSNVDDITIEWFMENPCETLDDLEKEYIKWYFEMGDLWINDSTRIKRNLEWGRKFEAELEDYVNGVV